MAEVICDRLTAQSVAAAINEPEFRFEFSHVDADLTVHFKRTGFDTPTITASWDHMDTWMVFEDGHKMGEICTKQPDITRTCPSCLSPIFCDAFNVCDKERREL